MFKLKVLHIFALAASFSFAAQHAVYQAEVNDGARVVVRVLGSWDSGQGRMHLQMHRFDSGWGEAALVSGTSKKRAVDLGGTILGGRMWEPNVRELDDLLHGQLMLTVQGPGGVRKAAFKRLFTGVPVHVTITNLTRGQIFSPPLVASHTAGFSFFEPGGAPPDHLISLAEEGDGNDAFAALLSDELGFFGALGTDPIPPGGSVTLTVLTQGSYSNISVMGMLVSTNDGFFSASDIVVPAFPPFKQGTRYPLPQHHMAYAYDAGSEANSEDCGTIPGPPCGQPGQRDTEGAEGFVSIHAGIHGEGDLSRSVYDWRGPVARISIHRDVPESLMVIHNTTVIDGTGAPAQTNASVWVEGNRISAITTDALTIPEYAQIVDGSGMFVVPGLIDTHTHYWESGSVYTSPLTTNFTPLVPFRQHTSWVESRAIYTLSRFLCGGVTSAIEMSSPFSAFDLRRRVEGLPHVTRLFLSGRLIANLLPGGFNYWLPEDGAVTAAMTVEEGRQLVRENIEMGANVIKLGYIPLPDTPTETWLPVFDAILEEAHAAGLRVSIHGPELENSKLYIRHGVDILAHPVWDQEVDEEFIELARQNDVEVMSTLYVFKALANAYADEPQLSEIEHDCGDTQIVDSWTDWRSLPEEAQPALPPVLELVDGLTDVMMKNVRTMHEAGITIIPGSDAGNIGLLAGASLHREFDMMAEIGMTPMEILHAATYQAAGSIDLEHELGAIKEGYLADMLILGSDPQADHRALTDIRFVVKDGALIPHETLQRLTDDTPALVPHVMEKWRNESLHHLEEAAHLYKTTCLGN